MEGYKGKFNHQTDTHRLLLSESEVTAYFMNNIAILANMCFFLNYILSVPKFITNIYCICLTLVMMGGKYTLVLMGGGGGLKEPPYFYF